LVAGATMAEEWGLVLAAPVSLCLFLTTIILALMTRAAPQLNLYSIGFPMLTGVGLGAIVVLLPDIARSLVYYFGHFSQMLTGMV
jgi:flagellar biosynthetic protein FliR